MNPSLRTAALFLVLTGIFVAFGWIIGTVFFGDWVMAVISFLLLAAACTGAAPPRRAPAHALLGPNATAAGERVGLGRALRSESLCHLLFPAPPGATRERENTMLCAPLLLAATASEAAAAHDGSPAAFTALLFVFLLATFIGLGVVTRVSRLLHTPLMSLTNAISAIAVVGSIVIAGQDHPPVITLLGAIALAASMTNIVSGFLITDRMLRMFKKPGGEKRP